MCVGWGFLLHPVGPAAQRRSYRHRRKATGHSMISMAANAAKPPHHNMRVDLPPSPAATAAETGQRADVFSQVIVILLVPYVFSYGLFSLGIGDSSWRSC